MAEITPSRILTELDAILTLVDGSAPGVPPLRGVDAYNTLTSGQETMPRSAVSSNATSQGTGLHRLTYFTAITGFLSSQVRLFSGGTAAAATPTLARVGLYTVAANGDGTLVASTPNDTALFASTNTAYTKSWSTPYTLVKGQRYALGVLVVTAATAPSLTGQAFQVGTLPGAAPRITGGLTGQADLLSSFLGATVGDSSARNYGVILP